MQIALRRSLLVVFCLLCITLLMAGFNTRAAENISPTQWSKLTNDKAFGYKNDIETVKPPVQNTDPGLLLSLLQSIYAFLIAIKYLVWTVVIAGIIYMLYRMFAGNGSFMFMKKNKMLAADSPPEDSNEDVATTNWEGLLQQAINNKDTRLAIRYRYMWLLQMLQKNGLIQYRNDKTNYQYYTELNETKYKQPFKQLSRQYEYSWYGNYALSPAADSEYSELFNNLRQQLGA